MKQLIVIGGLIALAAGSLLYYRNFIKPKEDLKLTALALRHVTSWHEESEGPYGAKGGWMSTASDTVCPIGTHYIVDDADSIPTDREYFATRKHIYYRLPDRWATLGTPADQCTPPLHLDAVGIYLPFEVLLSQARVRAQGVRTVGSESCRDYLVETVWREFTICVNESDHLPREIVSSLLKDEKGNLVKPERVEYSKWNNVSASDFPADIPTDAPTTN